MVGRGDPVTDVISTSNMHVKDEGEQHLRHEHGEIVILRTQQPTYLFEPRIELDNGTAHDLEMTPNQGPKERHVSREDKHQSGVHCRRIEDMIQDIAMGGSQVMFPGNVPVGTIQDIADEHEEHHRKEILRVHGVQERRADNRTVENGDLVGGDSVFRIQEICLFYDREKKDAVVEVVGTEVRQGSGH